jgi:hypothetical protein
MWNRNKSTGPGGGLSTGTMVEYQLALFLFESPLVWLITEKLVFALKRTLYCTTNKTTGGVICNA